MKCKDCYKDCPYRRNTIDAECVFQQWTAKQFDWQSFRAEAAKDILCGIVAHPNIRYGVGNTETQVGYALQYADELIKQLKEKEEK